MSATTVGRTAEWAPQWWRSGARTRLWWGAAIGFPVILAADAYVTWDWPEAAGFPSGAYVEALIGVAAEATIGLLFWMWRPGNIVGPCLSSTRHWFSLPVTRPDLADFPARRHDRVPFWWVFLALYVHMLLVFPNGEFSSRWARPLPTT